MLKKSSRTSPRSSARGAAAELVQHVVEGYFDELVQTREMLNSRYDDLKSGRVKPISRDEVIGHFRGCF